MARVNARCERPNLRSEKQATCSAGLSNRIRTADRARVGLVEELAPAKAWESVVGRDRERGEAIWGSTPHPADRRVGSSPIPLFLRTSTKRCSTRFESS